jgi:hypothetical protein
LARTRKFGSELGSDPEVRIRALLGPKSSDPDFRCGPQISDPNFIPARNFGSELSGGPNVRTNRSALRGSRWELGPACTPKSCSERASAEQVRIRTLGWPDSSDSNCVSVFFPISWLGRQLVAVRSGFVVLRELGIRTLPEIKSSDLNFPRTQTFGSSVGVSRPEMRLRFLPAKRKHLR